MVCGGVGGVGGAIIKGKGLTEVLSKYWLHILSVSSTEQIQIQPEQSINKGKTLKPSLLVKALAVLAVLLKEIKRRHAPSAPTKR